MVIDDSDFEIKRLDEMLNKSDYVIFTASNGNDGIKAAQEVHPDVILMDVVMPELNGFQATRLLTQDEKTSDIPVILVTTKNQPTDKMWAKRQGARAYLVKPVSMESLEETIRKVQEGSYLL